MAADDVRERLTARIEPRWHQGLDVGDGWLVLLDDLDRKIAEIAPDYTLHQVKEKFGGLRFYHDTSGLTAEQYAEVDRLVNDAEQASYHVCEVCGDLGTTSSLKGWINTLCDDHREARR